MPFFQDAPPPPQYNISKDSKVKPPIRQESHGDNSPNIVVIGDNNTVTVEARSSSVLYAGFLTPGDFPDDSQEAQAQPFDVVRGVPLTGTWGAMQKPPFGAVLKLGNVKIVGSPFWEDQTILSSDGKPFLTIGFDARGLWISTRVADAKGRYIVRIIKNEFQASNERAFNPAMPDKHSLVVRDEEGREVLNLYFLNPDTIHLTGKFMLENGQSLVLDDEKGIMLPNGAGFSNMTLDSNFMPLSVIDVGTRGLRLFSSPPHL
jgi:hypothetical protein